MNCAFSGVNLGGWLVLEPWLAPQLFERTDAKDERTLSSTKQGRSRILQHRKTFITEDDFKWLHKHNVTMVRIPVGYWILRDQDGYLSSPKVLDWAFKMAQKYHIKILLCLHGAKGSQNGKMHSGEVCEPRWHSDIECRQNTQDTLIELALRYRDSPALWGIELLNEPEKYRYFQLLRFYRDTYKKLQSVLRPGVYTVFHDGFIAPIFSGALRAKKEYPVAMDIHIYTFDSPLKVLAPLKRFEKLVKAISRPYIMLMSIAQPVIIGEWSGVLPQATFDKADKSKHEAMINRHIKNQQRIYDETAHGWMYWNYTANGPGMWNFKSLVDDKIITISQTKK